MGTEVRELLKKVFFVLGFGFLTCLTISYKAWFALSIFPKANVFPYEIPYYVFQSFSVLLIFLVFVQPFWFANRLIYRLILLTLVILFLFDFGLIQPWAWMYFIFIWASSLFAKYYFKYKDLSPILAVLKVLMAFIYIFSGIFKFNPNFEEIALPYILMPATNYLWQYKDWIISAFSIAPFVEIALGVSLLFNSISMYSKFGLIAMHLFVLLMIGPLGLNHNMVVWPWNLQMIFLLWFLFPMKLEKASLFPFWNLLFKRPFKYIVYVSIALFGLGFTPYGNPYMAFDLYSGGILYKSIAFNKADVKLMPSYIDIYTEAYGDSIYVNYYNWSAKETQLPPCPMAICDTLYKRKIKEIIQ